MKATNVCGSSAEYSKYLWVEDCGDDNLPASVYPNPATTETTISLESTPEKSFDASAEWDLEVYDLNQQLKVKKSKLKGKEYKLNTSNWKEGVYVVRINYKGQLSTEKLVIKKQ